MVKRREWKAWMVVDKRGRQRSNTSPYKKWLYCREDCRIIRVRIVEVA